MSFQPSTQQIDSLLRFLPAFKRQGFWFERVIWESGQISSVEKSPEARMFLRTLRDDGWVLAGGNQHWKESSESWVRASAGLGRLDLDGLQRAFSSWVERDRLLPGHLGALYERGDLTAALERLQAMRDVLPERAGSLSMGEGYRLDRD